MAEYIEREEAKETVKYIPWCDWKTVGDWLDEIPAADVVEVVRCKDCKWFGRDLGYGKHDCKKYEMPYCLETDFCSYGERRADR